MVHLCGVHGSQGKRFAPILGIIGALDAPIVYFSTTWWRTAHPELNIGPLAKASLDSSMHLTMMVSVVAFTVLFAYLVSVRYSIKQSEKDLDRLYRSHV